METFELCQPGCFPAFLNAALSAQHGEIQVAWGGAELLSATALPWYATGRYDVG